MSRIAEFVSKLEKTDCPNDEQPCPVKSCGCLLDMVVEALDPDYSHRHESAPRLAMILEDINE